MVSSMSISMARGSWVMVLGPLHFRRHRGEDRIDVAARLEPEQRAAIVQQVEFDVAPAPDQLFFAIGRVPGRVAIAPDKFGIDFQERAADVLGKGEIGIPVARIVVIVEYAADAACLLAVRQIEIYVAPLFVFLVA